MSWPAYMPREVLINIPAEIVPQLSEYISVRIGGMLDDPAELITLTLRLQAILFLTGSEKARVKWEPKVQPP